MISLLLAWIGLLNLVSTQYCQCSDYNTLSGCTNFVDHCYWRNSECMQLIASCNSLPTHQCRAPSCQLADDNSCTTIKNCGEVNLTITNATCSSFGCVQAEFDSTLCNSFDTCPQIRNVSSCQNFVNYASNSETFCAWDFTQLRCAQVSANCSGLNENLCNQLYFCQFNADSSNPGNACQNIVCGGLNEVKCLNAKSNCVWQNSTSAPSLCVQNKCSNYKNETMCNQQKNFNFCAWNGKNCNQCIPNKATYMTFTAVIILLLNTFIL